jgi:hypothetical protein
MISDTLADAIFEIEDYLKMMPEVYSPIEQEIREVVAVMDALRKKLDTLPSSTDIVNYRKKFPY